MLICFYTAVCERNRGFAGGKNPRGKYPLSVKWLLLARSRVEISSGITLLHCAAGLTFHVLTETFIFMYFIYVELVWQKNRDTYRDAENFRRKFRLPMVPAHHILRFRIFTMSNHPIHVACSQLYSGEHNDKKRF
jgi:hypothetical protein